MTHVVTVSAAQQRFLGDALTSVRSQTYRASEVVVLPWGPGEESATIAAARNHALTTATGSYLRLLEASDTLPWHSTALLVRLLRGSGCAWSAGVSVSGEEGWRDRAFRQGAGLDPGLADRLVDVAAWRTAGLAFDPAHGRFGDATVLRASDLPGVLDAEAVVHEDHDRVLGLPFGHLRRWAEEADAWLAAIGAGLERPRPEWASAVLDRRLPALLSDVESLADAQWQRLAELAVALNEVAQPEQVRAESRVLAWLVARGDRDRTTELVLSRWRAPDDFVTEVHDGQVYADFGIGGVPDDVRRLSERETPLDLRLQSRSTESVELVGFIHGVPTTAPPSVLITRNGSPLNVAGSSTPTATRIAAEAEHDHAHAWLTVERPTGRGNQAWHVELTSRGVTRADVLTVPAGNEPAAASTDPRSDDEVGPFAQLQLQRWYAGPHDIEPDLAYFQAYTGQHPTDSPLAIHHALRRLHPEIRVRWLVDDPSVPVPEGAEPVLIRSRAWYRTLASARWLVTNIEMERWFRRKPGQALMQTFHGNPGKTMGLSAWRRAGLTPGRIEQTLDHGPRNWTMLVSPSPEMTRHYREQFGYAGPVVEHGYPRDDVLLGPEAPAIRLRARDAFGIGPEQVAVLYAPTWRDQLALNYRRAQLHGGFDVASAAAQLGERYVLLLRGHRFHRESRPAGGARVLDVTTYPEVNDLILAADAAVLDYSSIRFDFALTGRPMVFCVPDLEEYARGRGFLYDFRDSAPGPLVRTTEEVVSVLRDLPAVEREYADIRAVFHGRFNAFQDGHAAERAVAAFFGPG